MKKIIEYKYFFAVLFGCFISQYFLNYVYPHKQSGVFYQILYLTIKNLPLVLFWLYLGNKTNNVKAGLYSAGACFLSNLIFYYVFTPLLFPTIIAVFVFCYFSDLKGVNRAYFIISVSAIICSVYGFSNFDILFNYLFNPFDLRIYDMIDVFQYINILIAFTFLMFFIPVLYSIFNKDMKFSFHDLVIREEQSNLHKSFVYFFFFWVIIISSYNLGEPFRRLTRFFLDYNSMMNFGLILGYMIDFVGIVMYLIGLYFITWYYRKILLQYMISRSLAISWGYYFANFPIVRLVLWIIAVSSNYKINRINYSLKSIPNGGILVLMFLFIGIKLLWNIERLNAATLTEGMLSIIILLVFVNSEKSIYYLNALRFLFLAYLLFFIYTLEIRINIQILMLILVLPIFMMIVQLPIFHLGAFTVIDNVEENKGFENLKKEE